MLTKAIVRPPAANFFEGLTTSSLGQPNYERALQQHNAYCAALESCGLQIIKLPPDQDYPDSTFVEDTAVLTRKGFVLTRPGALTRAGEVAGMRDVLKSYTLQLHCIKAPGSVDGGDVCEAGDHFFIGISERTNEEGARQLAEFLAEFGYRSTLLDVRKSKTLLHLKTGLAYLGDNRLVVNQALADREEFAGYQLLRVEPPEAYAANCIRVNDCVLLAAGFPLLKNSLESLGYSTISLEMSEFQKMDGGLSCLSLRF